MCYNTNATRDLAVWWRLPKLGSVVRLLVTSTQTRTLLIDYDNGRRPSDDRAQAILRQLGMGPGGLPSRLGPDFNAFRWLSYPNPRINLSDHEPLDQFRAYIAYRGYGVVAVDGLSTVLPAGVKMTEEGARSVLDGLRYVADDTGTAFSLLHHNNKAGTGSPQSVGQDLFGSQMILAAADTAWRVDRVQEKGQRTNKLNLYCTKNRLGPELAPFSMEFYCTPRADDPTLMERTWFVSTIPQPPKVEQEKMSVWPVVKHVLQDGEALSQVRLIRAIIDAWDDIHPDVDCFGDKRLRSIVKALAADDARPLIMQETERGYAFKLL